jgi:pimeloyl-ACP methyl ester carboxylesterase
MTAGGIRGRALADTPLAPWQLAARWGARGYVSRLKEDVHWVEFGAGTAGPPIVFVHGLGGSHLNWALVGAELGAGRRALALDLSGFGLTPGSWRTATIEANRGLLGQFLAEIAGEPAILVGNSMGGMLAILQAAARPESVAGLILISPALPLTPHRPDLRVVSQMLIYAAPGLGEAYLKAVRSQATPAQLVQRVIELCFADPARADPAMVEAAVDLAEIRRSAGLSDDSLLAAARSLMKVAGQSQRYWAKMASLRGPVLLVGGTADRLVPAGSVRAAGARNPGWETVILDDVGHTPQLEAPQALLAIAADWLDRHFGKEA